MKIISRYPGATYRVEHLGDIYLAIRDLFSEESVGTEWYVFKEIKGEKGSISRYESIDEIKTRVEIVEFISGTIKN